MTFFLENGLFLIPLSKSDWYNRGTVKILDWVVPRQKNYQKHDFFLRNWIISNTIFKNWVVPYGHFKKLSGSMEPLEPPLTAPLPNDFVQIVGEEDTSYKVYLTSFLEFV